MGETCCELEATEEALMAEAGLEEERMVGRTLVCSCEGFRALEGSSCGEAAAIVGGIVGRTEGEVLLRGIREGELVPVVMVVRG
jgi:hypothetical protein